MFIAIHRLTVVIGIGCLIVFTQMGSVALADNELGEELYTAAKKEFVEKFDKFKKEGLTADQVKELTDQLLEVAGDKIDGTGTETLLKTMNKQAKNTVWIMKKKESIEELIDFVGDVYAMGSSDVPPDPEEAYKALSKGVDLAAKLADEMPVMKVIAVPMLKAYAQAIRNGEKHIEAIASATKAKNDAIELGWESMGYGDVLAETEMYEAEDDEPTEEELQWEADRIKRQADYGECLSKCNEEYNAYNEASDARTNAWKRVTNQKSLLDEDKRSVELRRTRYNALIPDYKGSRTGYRNALKRCDNERARMQQAKSEGNEQGYLARKEMLKNCENNMLSWKENLHKDYKKVSQRYSEYLEAKIKAAHTRGKYSSLLEAYKKIDRDFKKAKAAFDACMKKCSEVVSNWSGTWETPWDTRGGGRSGNLTIILTQKGTGVTGQYDSEHKGIISNGIVTGNTLDGTFSRMGHADWDEDPNTRYSGSFTWTMAIDHQSFEGTWSNSEAGGPWNGVRR